MTWPIDAGSPGAVSPGEIVVWRIATITDPARSSALLALLSPEERARAAQLRAPASRAGYTSTRAMLRRILARHLGLSPASLRLEYGQHGKPHLAGSSLHFSVTHAGDGALIAVARAPVGVDLEEVRAQSRSTQILNRWFAPATRTAVLSVAEGNRLDAFYAAWTQREAYVKAVGGGVFATPDRLPLVFPGAAAALVVERGGEQAWTVLPLQPWRGYRAAAVTRGAIHRVRLFDGAALDD